MNNTTINSDSGYFIFEGTGIGFQGNLYTLDLQTGAIIHSPSFPNTGDFLDVIGSLRYDDSTKLLYGLWFDNSLLQTSFVSVSADSGLHQSILALPNIQTFDPESIVLNSLDREYILSARLNATQRSLYVMNIDSGTIKHNPTITLSNQLDWISSFQVDNNGDLFALYYSDSLDLINLVTINKSTGAYTKVSDLSMIKNLVGLERYYDSQSNLLVYPGRDTLNNDLLFKIDPTTGQISSTVPFPVLNDTNDNVIQLTYNKADSKLYGLHWDSDLTTSLKSYQKDFLEFNVYPNPAIEGFRIVMEHNAESIDLLIYNSSGQLIDQRMINKSGLEDEYFQLPSGSYFILIHTQDGSKGFKQIIVE
tara:strand:+ start:787 stop:1875 length:1089 start_codon:yes stop_codon:yes gene_type:complete